MSVEKSDKPAWKNDMALATVLLAVCATFSTFKGGGYSTLALISQSQASDQWSFYQAKSLKQHLQELQLEQLQLQSMTMLAHSSAAQVYAQHIALLQAKLKKYKKEKAAVKEQAHLFEVQRDEAKRHGKPFGRAVIFLQVAILLNSIAGLLEIRKVWWTALPVGLEGVFFFLDGFFLFLG